MIFFKHYQMGLIVFIITSDDQYHPIKTCTVISLDSELSGLRLKGLTQ